MEMKPTMFRSNKPEAQRLRVFIGCTIVAFLIGCVVGKRIAQRDGVIASRTVGIVSGHGR